MSFLHRLPCDVLKIDRSFVEALGREDDDEAAADALAGLADYREDFSAFVADANPFLPEAALAGLIESHTDHLVSQADAYAAGEYDAAHRLARDAYAHAGELSASLAAAIGDQFPQRFPDASMADGLAPWPLALGIGLLLGGITVGAMAARRRRAVTARASVSG
jgi:hypothetical protein